MGIKNLILLETLKKEAFLTLREPVTTSFLKH